MSWSGFDVPQTRHAMSSSAKPLFARPRIACAVSEALLCVGWSVAGSIA